MKKIIMKADHTPAEVDAIHDYAEVIYYLTVTDAMHKAEEEGMFSMNMAPVSMDGQSMKMMPRYDYGLGDHSMRRGRSYDDEIHRMSMDGRRGRDGDNDGRYSERHGRMPRDVYDWESERYPERY